MTDKWKHIRPSEYDWDYFKDTNGRETSMVRTLITGDEYIWEASLRPNYVAESHWHPYDIVQIFLEGEFTAASIRLPSLKNHIKWAVANGK